jgi:uncharacterized protein YjbJ (UPF0337 family)
MTRSTDQLRQDIEKTRRDLSYDVAALTNKVSPQRIIGERVDRVRGAFRSVKDKVMGTASDIGHTGRAMTSSAAHQVGTTTAELGEAGRSMASSTAHRIGDTASAATHRIGDTAASASHRIGDIARSAGQMPRQQMQGSPLAAGLIAFGLGALISSMFPTTPREQRIAGRMLDEAYERAGGFRQQAMGAAQHVRQDVAESVRHAAMEAAKSASHGAAEVLREGRSAAHDLRMQAHETREAARRS